MDGTSAIAVAQKKQRKNKEAKEQANVSTIKMLMLGGATKKNFLLWFGML
jgi:hypothetical protein